MAASSTKCMSALRLNWRYRIYVIVAYYNMGRSWRSIRPRLTLYLSMPSNRQRYKRSKLLISCSVLFVDLTVGAHLHCPIHSSTCRTRLLCTHHIVTSAFNHLHHPPPPPISGKHNIHLDPLDSPEHRSLSLLLDEAHILPLLTAYAGKQQRQSYSPVWSEG